MPEKLHDSAPQTPTHASSWWVYMLRCADNTLYTGITTDVERRTQEHNGDGRGAKFTRARRPVTVVYCEPSKDRSSASQREYQIKRLSKSQKEALVLSQLLT